MIQEKKPITMAEARELLQKLDNEKAQTLATFIKKFTKASSSEAHELKKKLLEHNMIKLNEEDIVRLIDCMPEDAADVRKIVAGDMSLDQDEIGKILSAFRKK